MEQDPSRIEWQKPGMATTRQADSFPAYGGQSPTIGRFEGSQPFPRGPRPGKELVDQVFFRSL